jgi:phage-related protein
MLAPTLHLPNQCLIEARTLDSGGNSNHMKRKNPLGHYCLMLVAIFAIVVAAPVKARSQNVQPNMQPQNDQQNMQPQNDQSQKMPDRDDVTRRQLVSFDNFLDSHPEVAEQLRKDPSLVNNQEFVEKHPQLQQYMQQHPEIREELSQNPNAFMHQEERFDHRFDHREDVSRSELANMDSFMDSHPEIAEQLRKDPSLVDNKQFVKNHPALQQFLSDHVGVREEYEKDPNAFMHREERFDRGDDQAGHHDVTRSELENMDRFMDSHPEIAEQLRKDPSLVDNKQFVKNHPALQQFLADHVGVREEYKENPNAFMHDEERFDRREDSYSHGDRDAAGRGLSSFNEFMEGHRDIASELSKTPSLANNQEYLENHPALQDYLKAHPEIHEELSRNPQGFLESAQQFNAHSTQKLATDSKLK